MDAVKTSIVVSLVVSMALLGACGSASPTRGREGTPELIDARPVLPSPPLVSPPKPAPPTPPPTLAPAPALVPPVATSSSAPRNQQGPNEVQPSTPAPVTSAVIGATNGAGANLRTGPSMQAPVITTLAEGTPVEALDEPVSTEGRSWRKVRSGDREGWVLAVVVQPR